MVLSFISAGVSNNFRGFDKKCESRKKKRKKKGQVFILDKQAFPFFPENI